MAYFPSVAWVSLGQPIDSYQYKYTNLGYHMDIRWLEGGTCGNDILLPLLLFSCELPHVDLTASPMVKIKECFFPTQGVW